MKKLLAVVLCLALLLLAGCSGGNDNNSSENEGGSIVSSGKIEGIDFGIGADVATVKQHYSALAEEYKQNHTENGEHSHGEDEQFAYYELIEKTDYSIIDIADARFYYLNAQEDKGIAAVATDSEAFGFTPGITTKYEVEEANEQKGDTLNATDAELIFLAVRQEEVIILRYEYDNLRLDYYFYDNLLITTVLFDTDVWKL
jgi:hypothetical protein